MRIENIVKCLFECEHKRDSEQLVIDKYDILKRIKKSLSNIKLLRAERTLKSNYNIQLRDLQGNYKTTYEVLGELSFVLRESQMHK